MMQGRADDAIAAMTRARNLDPLSDLINANLGWFYYLARRYPEALAWSRRLVELDRKLIAAHYNLGMVFEQTGRYREAVAAFQKAKNLDPTNWPTSALLCHGYASSGDRRRAQQLLLELTQQATRGSLDPAWIGLIHAVLGDKERAFVWLEKAYQARSDTLLYLRVDPKYDNLRSDPRFSDLVKRLNLRGPEAEGTGASKREPVIEFDLGRSRVAPPSTSAVPQGDLPFLDFTPSIDCHKLAATSPWLTVNSGQ
jgi:tetratricopeptide (TPR) repeat protein